MGNQLDLDLAASVASFRLASSLACFFFDGLP